MESTLVATKEMEWGDGELISRRMRGSRDSHTASGVSSPERYLA
jgi:hypothetical protein